MSKHQLLYKFDRKAMFAGATVAAAASACQSKRDLFYHKL